MKKKIPFEVDIPAELESKLYGITVACTNCGFSGQIHVVKGVKFNESFCPRCECDSLIRNDKIKF